jgi:hypothetical protein
MSQHFKQNLAVFRGVVDGIAAAAVGDSLSPAQAASVLAAVSDLTASKAEFGQALEALRQKLEVDDNDAACEAVWKARADAVRKLRGTMGDREADAAARAAQMSMLTLAVQPSDAKYLPHFLGAWLVTCQAALGLPQSKEEEVVVFFLKMAAEDAADSNRLKLPGLLAENFGGSFGGLTWSDKATDAQRLVDVLDQIASSRPTFPRMFEALALLAVRFRPQAAREATDVWRAAADRFVGLPDVAQGVTAADAAWLLRVPATLCALGVFVARAKASELATKVLAEEMAADEPLHSFLVRHRRAYRLTHGDLDPSPDHVWPKVAKAVKAVFARKGVLADRFDVWVQSERTPRSSVLNLQTEFRKQPQTARMEQVLSCLTISEFYSFMIYSTGYVELETAREKPPPEAAAPAPKPPASTPAPARPPVLTPAPTPAKPSAGRGMQSAPKFCDYCKKRGHEVSTCWSKGAKEHRSRHADAKAKFLAATSFLAGPQQVSAAAAGAAPAAAVSGAPAPSPDQLLGALAAMREFVSAESATTSDHFFG